MGGGSHGISLGPLIRGLTTITVTVTVTITTTTTTLVDYNVLLW